MAAPAKPALDSVSVLASTSSGSLCTLPYPERFEAASRFLELAYADDNGPQPSQETQLMLWALKQQVVEGPSSASNKATGWAWSMTENAKAAAWKQLGNMSAMEAMRLYVRTVEEEHPNWYTALVKHDGDNPLLAAAAPITSGKASSAAANPAKPAATKSTADSATPTASAPAISYAVKGAWTAVPTHTAAAKRPCPRYEHGATVMDGSLYVIGGNYAGRYLGDIWRLDLNTSTWSQVATAPTTPPATSNESEASEEKHASPVMGPLAGHTVSPLGDKLLLVGGHVKARSAAAAGTLSVRMLDPATGAIKVLEPAGEPPVARGGHSATRVGPNLWVFGGEDATRKPLGDLHCLDLGGMVWSQPLVKSSDASSAAAKAWPGPRSAHSATAYMDRYVVIFGGGSAATCFSDLLVLDTQAQGGPAWITVQQHGRKVTPRAGHSAVVHGNVMYVVGGGNNIKGCTDVLGLDLSGLNTASNDSVPAVTWHSLASTPARDALSSEGISLLILDHSQQNQQQASNSASPVLLAFGGYNGKYHNTVSVTPCPPLPDVDLKPAAAASTAGAQQPAGPAGGSTNVAAAANGHKAEEPPKSEVEVLRGEVAGLQAALAAAREEAETAVRAAAAAAAGDAHELALLRKQLASTQSALDTASKGLEDARAALGRESAKVMRLEVEGAELLKLLSAAAEERKELEALRRQMKEAESKKGGGIWGYIAGGTPTS